MHEPAGSGRHRLPHGIVRQEPLREELVLEARDPAEAASVQPPPDRPAQQDEQGAGYLETSFGVNVVTREHAPLSLGVVSATAGSP